MAVIVISYRAPPEVVGAVRSIVEQSVPVELLVVNSGGGDVARMLRAAGLNVSVRDYPDRLYAGGARNRGLSHTTAPLVAFLAGDCRARPGWVAARLDRHRAGARAVASAVVNSHPRNMVAWAAHLSHYMRRLPLLPDDLALRYGASYERRLFDEYGPFSETLPTGEDTDFLERLSAGLVPVWEPRVQTVHLNPTRLWPFMLDEFRRGRRYGRDMARISGTSPREMAGEMVRQVRPARRLARAGLDGDDRRRALRSLPILRLALAARALGILTVRPAP